MHCTCPLLGVKRTSVRRGVSTARFSCADRCHIDQHIPSHQLGSRDVLRCLLARRFQRWAMTPRPALSTSPSCVERRLIAKTGFRQCSQEMVRGRRCGVYDDPAGDEGSRGRSLSPVEILFTTGELKRSISSMRISNINPANANVYVFVHSIAQRPGGK